MNKTYSKMRRIVLGKTQFLRLYSDQTIAERTNKSYQVARTKDLNFYTVNGNYVPLKHFVSVCTKMFTTYTVHTTYTGESRH